MANKRKTTTAIVAGVTAAALLLGGTFAWTSISQQARNEAIVDINPGGRLHDDFDGRNKDVYVENFSSGATGVDIFARIRLDQYFEVGQDAGINKDGTARKVNIEIGGDINDVTSWVTYKPGDTIDAPVQANDNWQWTLGNGEDNLPYYMPTFNMNKDSLAADINGTYEGKTEGDIVHYDDFVKYGSAEDAAVENSNIVNTEDGTEVYDHDEDTAEESEQLNNFDNGGITTDESTPIDSADVYHKENQTHTAEPISTTATVISMAAWLENPVAGNYWVYDTDGWAYWANPIEPETTTGLLLDSIQLSRVPDDNYYYGINVVGQFATASDWTMLYEKTGAEKDAMTAGAKQLMELITATNSAEDGGGENPDDNTYNGTLTLDSVNSDIEDVTVGTELPVEFDATDISADETQPDITDITVTYGVYNEETDETDPVTLEKDAQYTYTYDPDTEVGALTITDETLVGERLNVTDNNNVVWGDVDVTEEEETVTAVITIDGAVGSYSPNEEGYIYLNAYTTQVNEYTVSIADTFDLASLTATEATGVTFTPDVANKQAALTVSPFAWNTVTITATDASGATETVYVVPIFDAIEVTPAMDGTALTVGPGPYGLVAEGFAEGTDVEFTIEKIDEDITRCEVLYSEGVYTLSVPNAETATALNLVATQGETVVKVTLNLVNTTPSLEPNFGYIDEDELVGWGLQDGTYVIQLKPGHNYNLTTSVPHTFEGTVAWSVEETAPAYFGDGADATKKISDAVDPKTDMVKLHIEDTAAVGSTFVLTAQLTEGVDIGVYQVNVNIEDPSATVE